MRATALSLLTLLTVGHLASCTSGPASIRPGSDYAGAEDIPRTDKPFASNPDNFQFAIIGDRTGGHRSGVFRHAVSRINLLQPEFVVGVGDLIEGYKEDRAHLNAEWDDFDAAVQTLDMPFFYTVGNHDMGNEVMRKLWRERHGRDYYHFVYRDVLFISLNTEDPPVALSPETLERQTWLENTMRDDPERVRKLIREHAANSGSAPPKLPGSVAISEAQVAWTASILAQHPQVRWTIVLMHKPAWAYDHQGFGEIESLLADRPHTVIAGHEHYYNYSRRGGADYITMATTGGIWLQEDGGAFDHIAWVTMTDGGPLISNIALCGLLGTPAQTAAAMEGPSETACFAPDR